MYVYIYIERERERERERENFVALKNEITVIVMQVVCWTVSIVQGIFDTHDILGADLYRQPGSVVHQNRDLPPYRTLYYGMNLALQVT